MGLAEKRAILEVQAQLPKWKEALAKAAAGIPVDIEVNWDSLAVEGEGQNYGYWESIFITPLTDALSSICADQIGRDAFKAKFKKIILQNKSGSYSGETSMKLDGDTIIIDHSLANADSVSDRSQAWQRQIETAL